MRILKGITIKFGYSMKKQVGKSTGVYDKIMKSRTVQTDPGEIKWTNEHVKNKLSSPQFRQPSTENGRAGIFEENNGIRNIK